MPRLRAARAGLQRALTGLALALGLLLALQPPAARAGEAAALIADRVTVEGQSRLVAEGAVEVLYGTTRLRAARIVFDRASGRLQIDGPITLIDGDRVLILADAAELDSDLRNGILTSARVVLDQQLQLAAARVRRVEGRYTELTETVASTCRVCAARPVALWSIRARRVIHDQQERQLYFDDATFRVLDVPLLWLPRLRLPDPSLKRATGFLVPDLRTTSQLGTGIKVPYFIAIGDSRDLTLTPYLSPRTRTLELRYRQAFARGRIAFEGALSDDDVLPGKTRAYLFGTGAFALPRDFTLGFSVEMTSDPAYLLDYGYSGKDRLTSLARIERIRRNDRIVGRLINFRTLRDSEIPIEDTLPYFLGSAVWERRFAGIAGGEGRLALSVQGHQRTSQVDGLGRDVLRVGIEAGWRRAVIFGPGIEAELAARLTADGYAVGQDSAYPARFGLVTPALAATLRWPLAKTTRAGVTSVIEPVAQLAWSGSYGTLPPNEDSALVQFDEGNLLAVSRFPGHDRQETGLRAALGLSWTRIAPDGWSAGVTVGRVVRAEADPAFTPASGLDGTVSDWLLAGHLGWGAHLALTSRTLLNDDFGVTRSETRLGWAGDRLTLGATHVWVIAEPAEGRSERTNELTLDGAWRFAGNWTGSAGMRYDVDIDRAASARIGLAWRNECASFDLSLSRRFTSSTSVAPTTDVGLKVSLGGFGEKSRAHGRSCGG
jgi:LPS-assembly protein